MGQRISGQSFDFDMEGQTVHAESVNLTIEDNSDVAKTRGIPDGYTKGDVGASGDITLTTKALKVFQAAASAAGSYRAMPEKDLLFYAKAGDEEIKVEAFGCRFKVSDLLAIDTTSADKTVHKIDFYVTSPDFVKINGIPYLSTEDTRDLMS